MFRFFPNGLELAISPLIYFYVKSHVNPDFNFKRKDWLHFIPFFLTQTYAFFVYFSVLKTNDFGEKDAIAKNLRFDNIKQLDEYILLIALVLYLFYGYKELANYKKWLDNTTSDSSFPDFGWLKNIFHLSLVIGAFLLINNLLDIIFDLKNITVLHYDLLILFITFVIYYLGLKGYLQADCTFSKNEIKPQNNSSSIRPDTKLSETLEQLEKVMNEDKVFLDPKLSIYQLSNKLGISQKNLSVAINQHFKTNFRDFINTYRLKEVKSKLNAIEYNHMSILGIALECGFNSEASFYRIFKKNTGISPKEFIQRENTK